MAERRGRDLTSPQVVCVINHENLISAAMFLLCVRLYLGASGCVFPLQSPPQRIGRWPERAEICIVKLTSLGRPFGRHLAYSFEETIWTPSSGRTKNIPYFPYIILSVLVGYWGICQLDTNHTRIWLQTPITFLSHKSVASVIEMLFILQCPCWLSVSQQCDKFKWLQPEWNWIRNG